MVGSPFLIFLTSLLVSFLIVEKRAARKISLRKLKKGFKTMLLFLIEFSSSLIASLAFDERLNSDYSLLS